MPEIYMDVDIALSEVPVNIMPLVDDSDFKTVKDAIAYDAAGMDLTWNFVTTGGGFTSTAVTPTTGGAHDWAEHTADDGMYTLEIPADSGTINNDTKGFGWFTGVVTGVLPFRGPVIGFRAAALNNALIDGGDTLDVNATEISGDSTAADNLELALENGTAGYVASDMKYISSDSTAADNLEDVFDGTYAAANMKIFWENGAGATTKTVDDVGSTAIRSGTAQAGAAGTITLDASASATNNLYNGQICLLTGGTGAGQCRAIVDYIGSTKVASVTPNWTTNPGATSTFELQPASSILTHLLSMAVGKFSKSGNVYTFLDWDDATTLSTLTWSATGRTRS